MLHHTHLLMHLHWQINEKALGLILQGREGERARLEDAVGLEPHLAVAPHPGHHLYICIYLLGGCFCHVCVYVYIYLLGGEMVLWVVVCVYTYIYIFLKKTRTCAHPDATVPSSDVSSFLVKFTSTELRLLV